MFRRFVNISLVSAALGVIFFIGWCGSVLSMINRTEQIIPQLDIAKKNVTLDNFSDEIINSKEYQLGFYHNGDEARKFLEEEKNIMVSIAYKIFICFAVFIFFGLIKIWIFFDFGGMLLRAFSESEIK